MRQNFKTLLCAALLAAGCAASGQKQAPAAASQDKAYIQERRLEAERHQVEEEARRWAEAMQKRLDAERDKEQEAILRKASGKQAEAKRVQEEARLKAEAQRQTGERLRKQQKEDHLKQEQQAKRQAEAERLTAQKEAQRKRELEAKRKAEELRRQQEEETRRRKEGAARLKAEAQRQRELEAKRQAQEKLEAQRKAETERRKAATEARAAQGRQEKDDEGLRRGEAEHRQNLEASALEEQMEEAWRREQSALARKEAMKKKEEAARAKAEKEAHYWRDQALLGQRRQPTRRVITVNQLPEGVYRLRFGDQLSVFVWGHADLNQSVPVREDGTISFPLIGDIEAQRRSPRDVEQEIQERLNEDYVVNPQVTVRLSGAKFSVFGEVTQPGSYSIEGSMDLLTAISLAGGITKFGSSAIEIIRGQGEEKVTIRSNVDRILGAKEPNVEIWPHDTIHVRRRLF